MIRTLFVGLCAMVGLTLAHPVLAHFQLLYTPQLNHAAPATLPFKLVFTHPAGNGAVMDMATPEQFFVVHQTEKTDLLSTLKPITWNGAHNQGKAFEAQVPVRRNGDYLFALVPAPYHEEGEGYIQQFTKTIVNRGGVPSGWDEPLGLTAEIVPLTKPYALYAGMLFSAQVLYQGEPVPGAEIEVEFMNHPVVLDANRLNPQGILQFPSPAFETFVTRADAQGIFYFTVPHAGFWGFAAVDLSPEGTEHKGEPLHHEAVIWVQAHELR
ncbi:DUF4198 domain-containing protein [Thiorhodospira sibirica]|uniref:DUF4198 domain-containing protein n=1 Tax=Thiorhodospira sibirica TaxID=154347 RepID=UPI00022C596F|nr:DUF4198 domain-containing protein [Thiorhodospira sibirica]